MPNTENRNLTLTKVGADVKVEVTYRAIFSPFERRLAGLGMIFLEQLAVLGVDPPGSTTGRLLTVFPPTEPLPVTDGDTVQKIDRRLSIIVPRAVLDEDPDILLRDPDEIRCRIRIRSVGLPPSSTPDAFTDQEVLDDQVVLGSAAGARG